MAPDTAGHISYGILVMAPDTAGHISYGILVLAPDTARHISYGILVMAPDTAIMSEVIEAGMLAMHSRSSRLTRCLVMAFAVMALLPLWPI